MAHSHQTRIILQAKHAYWPVHPKLNRHGPAREW